MSVVRESTQEKNTTHRLEALGFVSRKDGRCGWPDRCVFVGRERHIWVEHKTEIGRLTPAQRRVFPKLEAMGEAILYAKGMSVDEIVTTVWTWATNRGAFR